MGGNQEFWEQLKQKYEEKNRILLQKEQELRLKLEAMDSIIDEQKNPCKDLPNLRSYTCPEAEEKPGFFKTFFSMFTSKPKPAPDPSPPAPLDIPTKESSGSKKSARYDGCSCDPCEADMEEVQKIYNVPQKESGDFCNCSVCSRISFPGWEGKQCPCNLVDVDDSCGCDIASPKPPTDSNNNRSRPQKKTVSSPSKLSLKSMDLFYMQNIQELASQQKGLLKHINDLEQKAKVYECVFKEYKNVDLTKEPCKPCPPPCPTSEEQKTNAELKLENFLLKNELKDMRLEIRQYLERMEGPMQFKIESERYKCKQLEQKLEEAAREKASIQELFQKELNSLKLQLCNANANVYDLSEKMTQTQAQLECFQIKCAKLEDDLIRQKISEAETIKSLQAALNSQMNENNVCKDECDLHQIARELSKILKECEPCGVCMNLPEDLTTAARLLKSLTDIIENKLNQAEPERNENGERKEIEASRESGERKQDLEIIAMQESPVKNQRLSITVESPPSEPEPPKGVASVTFQQEELAEGEAEPIKETNEEVKEIDDEPQMVNLDQELEKGVVITEIPNEPLPASSSVGSKRSKVSCACVNFPRSSGVNQLWPKTDRPVELQESAVLQTAPSIETKTKCACSVSKKLSEITKQEDKFDAEKCKLIAESGLNKNCFCNRKKELKLPEPDDNERFKLNHLVTADKSQDLLKSETSIKCMKVKENFPFDVDTQVDVLNKPPDGVHVTTTITNSGTLEVITEGPEGIIETTLVYTKSGNVEVVTEILHTPGKCKNKSTPLAIENVGAIEGGGLETEARQASEMKVNRSASGPAVMMDSGSSNKDGSVALEGFAVAPDVEEFAYSEQNAEAATEQPEIAMTLSTSVHAAEAESPE